MQWVCCFILADIGVATLRAQLPHLQQEPFALTGGEGTIMCASMGAVAYGVAIGQTTMAARSLCPALVVLPYDLPACESAAKPIWDVLATASDIVEPVSPECVFMVLRGQEAIHDARRVAELIAHAAHIPVRVGIGRTKWIAQRAALRNSNDDPIVVPMSGEAAYLAALPLTDAPSLDPKVRRDLAKLGVTRFGDLLALPPHKLPRALRKPALLLHELARGNDANPVRPLWPPRTLSDRWLWDEEISNRAQVEQVLHCLAERLSVKLSTNQEFCREATIYVGLTDRTWVSETERLALPASRTAPIYRAFLRLLNRLEIDKPIQSLEVRLGELGTGSGTQLALFDKFGSLPEERKWRMEAVLAHLRRRYGLRAVVTGRQLATIRRSHLWILPMGHLLSDPVRVATDHEGNPVRFCRVTGRRGRLLGHAPRTYDVRRILSRWRETSRQGALLVDKDVWRVEADPDAIAELARCEAEWRITATMD